MTQSTGHPRPYGEVHRKDFQPSVTLDIQIEIEPLPDGRFRGAEGITLDWQEMTPFMWAMLIILARLRVVTVLGSLAVDIKLKQPLNGDGDATGEVEILTANITSEYEAHQMDPHDYQSIRHIIELPAVTEAIWTAAEEKARLG